MSGNDEALFEKRASSFKELIMNKISVFVSYSWDSDEHKIRVQSFVEQLQKDGFEVYVDQDMSLGEEITRFMVL